ncbi:MAG: CHAT domain-containing protein [Bacteroidales bacterium]|nr:CHAT domain-containing protein [Bacteroidales bacterium]
MSLYLFTFAVYAESIGICSIPTNYYLIPAGFRPTHSTITHNPSALCLSPSACRLLPSDNISDTIETNQNSELKVICDRFEEAFSKNDLNRIRFFSDSLIIFLNSHRITDTLLLAKAYYFTGASLANTRREIASLLYFNIALNLLDKYHDDYLKVRVLNFAGYASNKIGDHLKSNDYFTKSLQIETTIYGENSPELIPVYISLGIEKINIRDYEGAIEIFDKTLLLVKRINFSPDPADIALLYQNKGVALANILEYRKAITNLLKALDIYETSLPFDDKQLNLINNIATSYFYLKDYRRCTEFFEKGYNMSSGVYNLASQELIKNYAFVLGRIGDKEKGLKILEDALNSFKRHFTENSREYIELLVNYAEYLRENKLDKEKPFQIYKSCYNYLQQHPWNVNLHNSVTLGYIYSLIDNGKLQEALDSTASILYRNAGLKAPQDYISNPDISYLKNDKTTMDILSAKYLALLELSEVNDDFQALYGSAVTAELMVNILEKIRLRAGEEESRILLGERYRDAYLFAIESFKRFYEKTGNKECFEKVFEYSEKSKAACLLASIRENKGLRAYVPPALADLEKELSIRIGYFEARINQENCKNEPDRENLKIWNEELINATSKRDSLISVFEKNYPDYYRLKYNTKVISYKLLPAIAGKKTNFISYVSADTILYIIVVNSKNNVITTVPADSGLFSDIIFFRNMLSKPDAERDAREDFRLFQEKGYKLYLSLIEPVKKYFISNRLIISPDKELSFIPFEAFLTANNRDTSLYHNRLPFLMNNYDISYTYSATLLSESGNGKPSLFNNALVFAPVYESPLYIDSINIARQESDFPRQILLPLKYAGEEADYVARTVHGKLFSGTEATKQSYINEAGKYDIIHLAMHTIIDENSPVNSGMIFSGSADSVNNIYLRQYEVYGVPLDAKMVVLSSCYTGSGTMYAGEGVLSFARSFLLSGSKSVVMSLWEVDDRSGAEMMKSFYKNIKAGMNKSNALRKARLNYLEQADMQHSLPYFWVNLVIYGDYKPLYIPVYLSIMLLIIIAALAVLYFHFKKR